MTCYKELGRDSLDIKPNINSFLNMVDALARGNHLSDTILRSAMDMFKDTREPIGVLLIKLIDKHYNFRQDMVKRKVGRKKLIRESMVDNFIIKLKLNYGLTNETTRRLYETITFLFFIKIINPKNVVVKDDKVAFVQGPLF